jgi:hypothetical protein
MLFAHLNRIFGLDRLRLRGLLGTRDEFNLTAATQNLRKLAKLIPLPTSAPAGRTPLGGSFTSPRSETRTAKMLQRLFQ